MRWTNPDLIHTSPETDDSATRGTATAVLGDIALLRDSATTIGLNLRTGQSLWRTDTGRFGTVLAWRDHVAVLSDTTGLWAIDLRTGETVWDIPFLAVNADPDAFSGEGELTAKNNRYSYTAPRTMIGLRPLD